MDDIIGEFFSPMLGGASTWLIILISVTITVIVVIADHFVDQKNALSNLKIIYTSLIPGVACLLLSYLRRDTESFIILLVIGVFCILAFIGMIIIKFYKKPFTDKMLASELRELSSELGLPIQQDDNTRYDSITAYPGKKILMTYTLLNWEAGRTLDTDKISQAREELLKAITSDAGLARYRKYKVTFIYKCMDKTQQVEVCSFEFTPSDYGEEDKRKAQQRKEIELAKQKLNQSTEQFENRLQDFDKQCHELWGDRWIEKKQQLKQNQKNKEN